jgi:hypothetical protein
VVKTVHKLARISYNSSEWRKPTGEARNLETGTFNRENGFGFEDWLFRSDWPINGWRYAFVQGANEELWWNFKKPIDLTLYAIDSEKRYQFVANIYALECLTVEQAKAALDLFRQNGWLDTMRREVEEIHGNVQAIEDSRWAPCPLNVRFRQENVDLFPKDCYMDDPWLKNRHRYQFYDFSLKDSALVEARIENTFRGRLGSQIAPTVRPFFRRGSHGIEYTPEHRKMQGKLLEELQKTFGTNCVKLEQDFIDATVRTDREIILYEIKTDLEPRTVIRNALGQILEYAYHPLRKHDLPVRLVIVGRCELEQEDEAYLNILKERYSLPLEYKVITI